ncbi:MAG: hypothetical protein CVV49_12065 [Spirochaetae bacterium HGW-Spirochaetae-5]|nr:MAG: hypothetical protein CVV49_12065 [Spirochaetae bacterium HGW-Spirochaetae-5]
MNNNKTMKDKTEERISVRRDILDTFRIFLTMPHLGSRKITIIDLSRNGISFESEPGMQLIESSSLECYLHLNESIRIPLNITVVHLAEDCGYIRAGCEITDQKSSAFKAYRNFVELLMSLSEFKKNAD